METENSEYDFRNQGRSPAKLSGVLLAGFAVPYLISGILNTFIVAHWNTYTIITVALTSLFFLLSGCLVPKSPVLGRVVGIAGLAGVVALSIGHLLISPGLSLALAIVVVGSIAHFVSATTKPAPIQHDADFVYFRVRSAILTTIGIGLFSVMFLACCYLASLIPVLISTAVVYLLILHSLIRKSGERNGRWYFLVISLVVASITGSFFLSFPVVALSIFQVPLFAYFLLERVPARMQISHSWWEPVFERPGRLLIGTFAVLCFVGAILLNLPAASAHNEEIHILDAVFTAVSAVCVTGLIVLDTPHDFSLFGQVIILILIQIGGLGIMTFSTAAIRALGKRMGVRYEAAVASLISQQDRSKLYSAAKTIILLTFLSEFVGALLLAIGFLVEGDTVLQAVWRGLFTSVSAFCNAGFALQSDSLIPYNTNPLILQTVSVLIILGGLSPVAVVAIPALVSRHRHQVSVQAKLALVVSLILLVAGFFFFFMVEYANTLSGLPLLQKIGNAWFQSVTLRTAGFNSIDIAKTYPATQFIMMIWMFIGGSPGGTAGGIKTTTIAVVLLAAINAARGRSAINIFRKRIPLQTLYKALAITTLGSLGVIAGIIAMQVTQPIPAHAIVFEVLSATGTVGLTVGATSQLDGIGKIIIIACMFVGRVGTLTFFVFLTDRVSPKVLKRPEEEVDVG